MTALILLLGVIAGGVAWVVSIFNTLIRTRNEVKNAFSQIDVQLKRRYDLIPNLVEVAKGYMKHERETLEAVIQARNSASQVAQAVAKNPSDGTMMKQLLGAESQLGQTLTSFLAVAESYPELKANQNMMQLTEELTSTENKIAFARQAYNDSVLNYNNSCQMFPGALLAGAFQFQAATSYEIERPAEREPIKVQLS